MADQPNEFAALMERVAQGDQQAFEEVHEKYHKAVLIVIRYHLKLSPLLRAMFDSTDFLQDVWHDVAASREQLGEVETREGLLNFLVAVARHKVEKTQRKYSTQKRDMRRRRHLSDPGVAGAAAAVADPHPGPAQHAASQEAWMRWIETLSPRQQRVVLLLRDGCTYQDIAAELGCSERSIRRMVGELRGMSPPGPLPSF